jgi:hypothetical protein
MTVAIVNQDIWRGGNYPPVVWGFGTEDEPMELDGASFELELLYSSPEGPRRLIITTAHDSLSIDTDAGTVTWAYSERQIDEMDRACPISYSLRYVDEILRQVWVVGRIMIKG